MSVSALDRSATTAPLYFPLYVVGNNSRGLMLNIFQIQIVLYGQYTLKGQRANFISSNAAQEIEKREESAASHWCFKVMGPYSTVHIPIACLLLFSVLPS
jgi:di/tricarboxylate transporter